MKVGNGEKTLFWSDQCAAEDSLKELFLRLFSISMQQNMPIVKMGVWDGVMWRWNFEWR